MRRSRSPWDDDDPAVRLLREALRLRAPDAPVGKAPRTDIPILERDRIAALVARIRAGDLSAVETLRDLISKSPG